MPSFVVVVVVVLLLQLLLFFIICFHCILLQWVPAHTCLINVFCWPSPVKCHISTPSQQQWGQQQCCYLMSLVYTAVICTWNGHGTHLTHFTGAETATTTIASHCWGVVHNVQGNWWVSWWWPVGQSVTESGRERERDMCITNDPSLVELMMTVRLLPVHAAAPCVAPCGNPL